MILPDANLLLYAYDRTTPFHSEAKAWWEDRLNGTEVVGLCPAVVFAFVRIATNALRLLQKAGSGGNLTTDAQIAASSVRLGARVETADTDFARFPVDWSNPLN